MSHDAIVLLNCVSVTLTAAAAAPLNGGPALSSGTAGSAAVRVSLLVDNPYYVCWARGGQQTAAGALAIVTFVVVVIGLPLGCLVVLLRDSGERRVRCSACWSEACSRGGSGSGPAPSLRRLCTRLPSFRKRPLLAVAWTSAQPRILRDPVAPAALRDRVALATMRNPMQLRSLGSVSTPEPSGSGGEPLLLAAFLSDYRPGAWYTRFADVALTLLISALQVR